MGRKFFDTNVLVYFFDHDEPKKQKRAQALIEREAGDLVLSTQVLKELFVALTRKLRRPLSGELAISALQRFARFPVVSLDPAMLVEGAQVSLRHQISFWDALILVAARSAGCDVVVSEDLQDGWQVLGLVIENPFSTL